MNNYLLTYEDCLKLVEVYKNFNFYKTDFIIDDYKISTFNYFLCDYNHFKEPLPDNPIFNAFNCRGITFVFNRDGSLYKRFFMLSKFFNLNQVEETQYNLIKNKKIKYVTSKEDGSLIAFMDLPNGKVFAKTQAGFTNEQSIAAIKIYNEDNNIKYYVNYFLNQNLTPLFEYVAFNNRIVLQYSKPELRLIGTRNNITGEYISVAEYQILHKFEIPCVNIIKEFTLDQLIEKAKIEQNIEGWVVELEDGQLIKVKTAFYISLHHLRTCDIFREDFIIENYLKETIDDVIGELSIETDKDVFDFIEKIKISVNNWSNHIEEKVNFLFELYEKYYMFDKTLFAKEQHKSAFFGLTINKINKPEEYRKRKIEYMLKETYHLNEARRIIEKWSKV